MSSQQPTADSVLQAIRQRGRWKVQLRPAVFERKRIKSLESLVEAVRKAQVRLRGWYYPHINENGLTRGSDFIQGVTGSQSHFEVWRLFQSGQFAHVFGMTEDWLSEIAPHQYGNVGVGELLEVTKTLWIMTEIFVFCGRLIEALALTGEIVLSYQLVGLQNRQLETLDPMRMHFFGGHKAAAELGEHGEELHLPSERLIASAPDLALDETLGIYERFGWSPDRASVLDDQRRLLERRF